MTTGDPYNDGMIAGEERGAEGERERIRRVIAGLDAEVLARTTCEKCKTAATWIDGFEAAKSVILASLTPGKRRL